MDLTTFIIVTFLLQALCMFVAKKYTHKLDTQSDYFLGGRQILFFPLMMTFIATQVGGGTVLGASEEAYKYGWSVLFYPLGASLGFIILGLGVGKRLASLNVSTVAQIFEKYYGSVPLKKIASLLSILSLFMILIGQFIASHKFMMTQGIDSTVLFIGLWSMVILYTALGGFKAVVLTDLIQAQFFILTFIFSFLWIVFTQDLSFSSIAAMGTMEQAPSLSKILGWVLMPLFFMFIEQDMAQRCFAGKSSSVVSKSTFWAGVIIMIVCTIPIFLGIFAHELQLQVPQGVSVMMLVITQNTNPIITAFVGCAILTAIISTADSLINAISSNVSQDFSIKFPGLSAVRTAQILTFVISTLGIFSSFYFESIVDILIQSYELSVSCLFVTVAFALLRGNGNKLSATLSVLFGAAGFLFFRVISFESYRELCSIGLSFLGFGLGELLCFCKNKTAYAIAENKNS